ncbi:MAG TPA: dockerin type I repeat-containing protein [Pirellulales bacterium]|jgi:hypothetical protein|nr:dockerin type I repeat-containing protein [Pirellulales bacterium]
MVAPQVLAAAPTALHAAVSSANGAATIHAQAAKLTTPAVAKATASSRYERGDLSGNGQVDAADIVVFLRALIDLKAYQTANQLSDSQLLTVGDINQDGHVNNLDLQSLIDLIKSEGTPPPPAHKAFVPIVPTGSNSPSNVSLVNSSTGSGAPVVSQLVVSSTAGAFTPLKSSEALLAGGGGDAQPGAQTVSDNGPPMPTRTKTSDIALIAFAPRQSTGGDDIVEGVLMKLADVEEPQLLAIEYGDEVVRREVTVNKKVAPQQSVEAPVIETVIKALTPEVGNPTEFSWINYMWLAIPAGAGMAAAAWWIYRQRLQDNKGTLFRRLGL